MLRIKLQYARIVWGFRLVYCQVLPQKLFEICLQKCSKIITSDIGCGRNHFKKLCDTKNLAYHNIENHFS